MTPQKKSSFVGRIILSLAISGGILASCTPLLQEVTVPTPTLTSIPVPTETTTPSPEPTTPPTSAPTQTDTPEPTATAEPERFSIEAITFVPKSVAEIGRSVEVASPIDDFEQHKKDMQEYVDVLHKKVLPNYNGPMIEHRKTENGGGNIGIGGDPPSISFYGSQEYSPISSVHFQDNGINFSIVSFVGKDDFGEKFIINMLFDSTTVVLFGSRQQEIVDKFQLYHGADSFLGAFPYKMDYEKVRLTTIYNFEVDRNLNNTESEPMRGYFGNEEVSSKLAEAYSELIYTGKFNPNGELYAVLALFFS